MAATTKIDSSGEAFATLEEAVAGLESATTTLVGSITRENGAPFSVVQAVWEAQKRLSEACKAAPVRGGDDLWPRVTAAKRAAEKTLAKSRHFHELWKRREKARKAYQASQANGRPEETAGLPTVDEWLQWEEQDDGNVILLDGGTAHAGWSLYGELERI